MLSPIVDLATIVMETAARIAAELPPGARVSVDVQANARLIRGRTVRLSRLVRELVVGSALASSPEAPIVVRIRRTNAHATLLEVVARRRVPLSLGDLAFAREVAREHGAAIKFVECEITGKTTTAIIFPDAAELRITA